MPGFTTASHRLLDRVSNKARAWSKAAYQSLRSPATTPQPLWVIGCQRSGTDMLLGVFERDWRVKVYGEFSALSDRDLQHRIRLNPLPDVDAVLSRQRVPLVVLKPLVETQNADRLLGYFIAARAVFMFRHYRDVAASNLKKFGLRNGINNLRPIVANDQTNWRAERVTDDVRELVLSHFTEDMPPHDAAALFWYVRNRLYLDRNLPSEPRARLLDYTEFVADPARSVAALYRWLELPPPTARVTQTIHAHSVGKGDDVSLSPAIEARCADLLAELTARFARQWQEDA